MIDGVAIASAATRLRESHSPILVATVVRIQGSSYRRPGARLVATTEGRVVGSVSGGCLERDVLRTGFLRTRSGPVVVRYDSRDPDEDQPVLGCGGVVEVLLEQGTAGSDDDPLSVVLQAVESAQPVMLATAFETTDATIPLGARWAMTRHGLVASSHPGAQDVIEGLISPAPSVPNRSRAGFVELTTARGVVGLLVEPVLPAPHLFIFGSGADVLPLTLEARHLGWQVTVWTASEAFDTRSRLVAAGATVEGSLEAVVAGLNANDRAMAVVMGHNLSRDREALKTAIASRAIYIGVLGPRHRTASLAAELPGAVLTDPRVHAPVGLDIGAETPEEIALSIASELLACARGASTEALRNRGNIHGDAA